MQKFTFSKQQRPSFPIASWNNSTESRTSLDLLFIVWLLQVQIGLSVLLSMLLISAFDKSQRLDSVSADLAAWFTTVS